jgi:hypothetical protein
MNILSTIDTPVTQIIISLALGLLLGIMYQSVSPKIIIINGDDTIYEELENKSFKDSDKCYRYKKVVTDCE